MDSLRRATTLSLLLLILLLSGCGKGSKQPDTPPVSLEGIRQQVAASFDGTIASAQRKAAGEEAMRQLLTFLGQPESLTTPEAEWAVSPRPGVESMVRHLELEGGIHLYALIAPGDSLVERRERVAVQLRTGKSPQAVELPLLSEGKVEAARAFAEGGKSHLALLLRTDQQEGYVALFAAASDGRFEPVADAFAGMAGQYGDLTLGLAEGFLTITTGESPWAAQFSAGQPLRLRLGPELTLDWKHRFVLVDDSRFDPFALMAIAADPSRCRAEGDCPEAILELVRKSPKEAAAAAWEAASAKLVATLQKESGWSADLARKLPSSGRLLKQEGQDLIVELLSLPQPEGVTGQPLTLVRFRTSNGIPMVRRLSLSTPVADFQVLSHQGLPALFLLVEDGTELKAGQRRQALQLLTLDAGNDWREAQGWVGSVPEASHWNLTGVTANGLKIAWDQGQYPAAQVHMESGADPRVAICKQPSDCHYLTWVDGRIHSLDILIAQLKEATAQLPEEQIHWRATQLAEFLRMVDPAEVPAAKLARLLDPDGQLGMTVLEAGGGTRLVSMPQNPSGLAMAVIHTKEQTTLVRAYDGYVTQWQEAKVVNGGGQQRLLILGRSQKGAVMLTYEWDGIRWIEGDPLKSKVSRLIKETMMLLYNPGETKPVRGLILSGGDRLQTSLSETGALFCEEPMACLRYEYAGGWILK